MTDQRRHKVRVECVGGRVASQVAPISFGEEGFPISSGQIWNVESEIVWRRVFHDLDGAVVVPGHDEQLSGLRRTPTPTVGGGCGLQFADGKIYQAAVS